MTKQEYADYEAAVARFMAREGHRQFVQRALQVPRLPGPIR